MNQKELDIDKLNQEKDFFPGDVFYQKRQLRNIKGLSLISYELMHYLFQLHNWLFKHQQLQRATIYKHSINDFSTKLKITKSQVATGLSQLLKFQLIKREKREVSLFNKNKIYYYEIDFSQLLLKASFIYDSSHKNYFDTIEYIKQKQEEEFDKRKRYQDRFGKFEKELEKKKQKHLCDIKGTLFNLKQEDQLLFTLILDEFNEEEMSLEKFNSHEKIMNQLIPKELTETFQKKLNYKIDPRDPEFEVYELNFMFTYPAIRDLVLQAKKIIDEETLNVSTKKKL